MYHKANLNRIMADYTGQPLSKIEEDTDRDRWGKGGRWTGERLADGLCVPLLQGIQLCACKARRLAGLRHILPLASAVCTPTGR